MTEERERVYVVPRAALFPDGAPHGFVPGVAAHFRAIAEQGFFEDRARVEDDPGLKQIIPYAVVSRGDRVFLFRRTDRGGERRLHGLRSIGVGGHVNPEDAGDPVPCALRREIDEELCLPHGWLPRFVGLLNDDTTPVGSVHVGIVAVIEPGEGLVKVREADTMSGSFVSRNDLLRLHAGERASFETWSALLIDRLDEVLAWGPRDDCSSQTPNPTPTSST